MSPAVRKLAYGVVLLVASVYAFVSLRGPYGIAVLQEKRERVRTLEIGNADLAKEVREKQERIRRLRESQAEQELEIRRRLKLLRPGETQFIIPGQPKNEAPETPEAAR
jgi:cell division protein FtsB